jgi:hypothetical protein
MKSKIFRLRDLALTFAFLVGGLIFADASWAAADFFEALHPYAELGIAHDSNVFRVQEPAQAGGLIDGTQTSDTYWTAAAGFDGELTHQKQLFLLNGRIFHNDYEQFDEVDFTGGEARVAWDWVAGSYWNGEVGYEFKRALRDFANQLTPHIDVGSSNVVTGAVTRKLSNRWQVTVDGELTDTEFSETPSLDLRRIGSGMSLAYVSRQDNTLSLDATYLTKESNGAVNLDYTEFEIGPVVEWRPHEDWRIRATVGYAERDQDNPIFEDYSGLVGRMSSTWTTSRASNIRLSLWREITSFGDEIATFAIVSGVGFDPTFQLGNHASVSLGIGYEQRDFQGEPEGELLPDPGISPRDDDLVTGTIRLEWKFNKNSHIACEYHAQDRQSTRAGKDYEFNSIGLSFRVGL